MTCFPTAVPLAFRKPTAKNQWNLWISNTCAIERPGENVARRNMSVVISVSCMSAHTETSLMLAIMDPGHKLLK